MASMLQHTSSATAPPGRKANPLAIPIGPRFCYLGTTLHKRRRIDVNAELHAVDLGETRTVISDRNTGESGEPSDPVLRITKLGSQHHGERLL